MYDDLYIRTQYDGHDYRSVLEIYHYDEDGEEEELEHLTDLCIDVTTCADQGCDTWSFISDQVAIRLDNAEISYTGLHFSDDEPSI